MSNKTISYFIIIFGYLAVVYPLLARAITLQWGFNSTLLSNLFPLFGILAFTLLWLHSLCGVFEPWLRKCIDFDRFVHISSLIILASIILHPLLLLASLDFNAGNIFLIYNVKYVMFGIIGWILLITYDIGKAMKRYDFFIRHWHKILIISNIGFLLTFFHSLYLGSDLQSGPLRILWIFYGITAMMAILYTYAIKRFLKKPAI